MAYKFSVKEYALGLALGGIVCAGAMYSAGRVVPFWKGVDGDSVRPFALEMIVSDGDCDGVNESFLRMKEGEGAGNYELKIENGGVVLMPYTGELHPTCCYDEDC